MLPAPRADHVRAGVLPPPTGNALAFLDKQDPIPAIRADLQTALDKVIAEQDDRAKIATDA